MGVLENSGKHWAFQPKHRRQYLYVHSKLYYGIQCRKHFPSQCKWPAQYYSGKQTQKRKKENPASSSTLLPSLGLLKSTLRKTKDPHCSLHLYISLTTHPSFCWCSVEMGQPLIWPNYMKHDLISGFIPCFYIPLPLSVNAEAIDTQTIQLVLWGVKKVWVDGREVRSMPEGGCMRRLGWVGKGCIVKGIHFIQTVCLAGWLFIWNCKSFPL